MENRFRFRAWDKKTSKRMWHKFGDGTAETDSIGINEALQGYIESEDWEVMQCTGLKDKNGKLIYEGDIVKYTSFGDYTYRIIYDAPSFDAKGFDNGDYYQGQDPTCHDWSRFKVVGNIYENPKLLSK